MKSGGQVSNGVEGSWPFSWSPIGLVVRSGASVDRETVSTVNVSLHNTVTTADMFLPSPVTDSRTGIVYGPGRVPAGTSLATFIAPEGTRFAPNFVFPFSGPIEPQPLSAGTDLSVYSNIVIADEDRVALELPAGRVLPQGIPCHGLPPAQQETKNLRNKDA